jgi:hypothetical protein
MMDYKHPPLLHGEWKEPDNTGKTIFW